MQLSTLRAFLHFIFITDMQGSYYLHITDQKGLVRLQNLSKLWVGGLTD